MVVEGTKCRACCTKLVDFGVRLGQRVVLEHVNLHLHCGELVALIGPNGAGKTTLLRAMLGELPHTGELQFMPVGRPAGQAPRIGYVPQRIELDSLSPISVHDLLAGAISRWPLWLGHRGFPKRQAMDALAMVKAEDLVDRRVGELSGGQLQRVLLALALTPVPDILLLDEPVSGIDQAGIGLFYERISALRKEFDLGILLISHDLEVVPRHADRMVFLNRTVLGEGAPAEVLSRDEVKRTFGFDAREHELPEHQDGRSWHGEEGPGGT